ncbi:MAG TPA: LytTR family DNA-binding domain-containing protein [Gammaproteobacteria bacterium]|nr:LytTR family DNA-binding domain-containing protein [Gammaproteobacteria bacterium]
MDTGPSPDAPAITLGRRTRLLMVLMLAPPVWGYGLFWDLSVARYYGLLTLTSLSAGIPGTAARVLEHILLFPWLVLAYYLAAGVFAAPGAWPGKLLKQALLMLGFALLIRPSLVLASYLTGGGIDVSTAGGLIGYLNLQHAWLHTTLNYSPIYVLGLCLLFALVVFARHREVQLRAAAMRSDRLLEQMRMLQSAVDDLRAGAGPEAAGRLAVKVGRKTRFLEIGQIERLEADGDYLDIHSASGERTRTRASIAGLEARLSTAQFVRIHRSVMVNTRFVRELRSNKRGGCAVVMASGEMLTVGDKYVANVQQLRLR